MSSKINPNLSTTNTHPLVVLHRIKFVKKVVFHVKLVKILDMVIGVEFVSGKIIHVLEKNLMNLNFSFMIWAKIKVKRKILVKKILKSKRNSLQLWVNNMIKIGQITIKFTEISLKFIYFYKNYYFIIINYFLFYNKLFFILISQ